MGSFTFDTEASGATNGTKGNPFSITNRLCCVSFNFNGGSDVIPIEYTQGPYGENLASVGRMVVNADLLVGFNIKYDLHWLKRYEIDFSGKRLWDTQLAHFILSHQKHPNPSLDEVAKYWDIGVKFDVVKEEYWKKGIDTPEIPWDILYEYALQDANLTNQIFLRQKDEFQKFPKLGNLFNLCCHDLIVTQEMEWSGLRYNLQKSKDKGRDLSLEIDEITKELDGYSKIPLDWNSNDHVSAFLYGGVIKKRERIQYPFTYKDGRQILKERWEEVSHILERQIEPLKDTEVKKGNYYEVNENVLRMLPAKGRQRKVLDLILKRNKMVKLLGTYFEGIPEIYEKYKWEDQIIHGSLNHCRAATGRLASSKPNQQNMDKRVKECIESRF